MDQLMKKTGLRLEMAVDRNSWRNKSDAGRYTRGKGCKRGRLVESDCNFFSSFRYVRPMLTRTTPIDLGHFSVLQGELT